MWGYPRSLTPSDLVELNDGVEKIIFAVGLGA